MKSAKVKGINLGEAEKKQSRVESHMGLVKQWRWLVFHFYWSELSTAKTILQPCVVISNPSSNVFSRGPHVKRHRMPQHNFF